MKEALIQLDSNYNPSFYGPESHENVRSYKPNQILRAKLYGVKKQRSVQQNAWIHCVFKTVSENTEDPDWNTPEKAKRSVKMAMRFFKDEVIVQDNKVWFEFRSFAFDKMEQNEANRVYNEALEICAEKIGVSPETLHSQAVERG